MRAVAERAVLNATFAEVLVLTARDIGTGPWKLVRLARVDGRWSIQPPIIDHGAETTSGAAIES